MSNGGGVNKGGRKRGRKSGSHARSGRIKGEMVAECCPLLCSSDKDRLAPQVSSLRRSQAQGQGRCMNKPAYKHLIITQAEEALWIKMSLFICFPFPHFGSLADFFLRSHSLTLLRTLSCLPYLTPLTNQLPHSPATHNMDPFHCIPHCLHHRAALGLAGPSICLLWICSSPCLSLPVYLSVVAVLISLNLSSPNTHTVTFMITGKVKKIAY